MFKLRRADKKELNKEFVIVSSVTILLVLTIAVLSLLYGKSSKDTYDVIFFGDSKVGNDRTESAVTNYLARATGLTVFNAGIGGTTLSSSNDTVLNIYNMVSMAKAAYLGDFGAQKASMPREYVEKNDIVYYIPETIQGISRIDFKKAKYIIIEQCVNDYYAKVPLINPENPYDITTVTGALRQSIKYMKAASPNAQIIVVSPNLSFAGTAINGKMEFGYGDEMDFGYGTEADYADALKSVCEELNVTYVDFYNDSGITRENLFDYCFDGLHPNEAGNELMVKLIKEKMN